jgi:pimeloyl-ACP methyl ester carboxylesterase
MNHSRQVALPSLLLLLALVVAFGAPPNARAEGPNFEPAPCMFPLELFGLPPESQGFECGYVTAPVRHAVPDGPTIRLPVAILRAEAPAAADPLFVAQGGPGGDAFEVYSLLMNDSPVALTRDIVIFNQRGAIYAEPDLRCTEMFDIMPQVLPLPPDEAMPRVQQAYTDCHDRLLREGVDLSAFNSLENAADVDSIRQALGYDQINFYGVSYGTLLGLHLMRLHPEHLRSVILDGVVPPEINFIPMVPQGTDRVLTRLFDACAADAACSADYPNLEARFFALVDRLDEAPVTIPLTNPETGQRVATYVDGQTMLEIVFQLLYAPDAYATFPRLIADLEQGDYDYIQAIWPELVFDHTFSDGMYYSVICTEDADIDLSEVPLEGIRPQIAAPALEEIQQSYLDVCAAWQVAALPSTVDDPVVSDIPTLLLSGQFDPITPPAYAEAAAANLSQSYTYIYPGGSHGVLRSDACVDAIVQDFLANPQQPPDGSCLADVATDAFVPASAIKLPLVLEVAGLKTPAMIRLVIAGLCLLGLWSAYLVIPLEMLLRMATGKSTPPDQATRRRGRAVAAAVLTFGLLAFVYVGGMAFFMWESFNSPMVGLSMLPVGAVPVLLIPWLLAPLALVIVGLNAALWRRGGRLGSKLYESLLALFALGYVVILALEGTLGALLG